MRWKKLGIIAGGGSLPERLVAACRGQDNPCHVIRLKSMAEESLEPGETVAIAEVGRILRTLRDADCDAVVMAGLVQRPDFSALRPDWRGAAMLPKLVSAAKKGDGAILAVLVDLFEAEGFLVVGAEEVLRDAVAQAGALGQHVPSKDDWHDIIKAHQLIHAIGGFDVGQGAVVAQGLVMAIEAAEGTDRMLDRCAELCERLEIVGRSGVLVKCPKPGQELRVDLPTIGPETARRAQQAGLSGIAILEGQSLIMDMAETRQISDQKNLFVYGYKRHELRDGPDIA